MVYVLGGHSGENLSYDHFHCTAQAFCGVQKMGGEKERENKMRTLMSSSFQYEYLLHQSVNWLIFSYVLLVIFIEATD